MANSHLTRLEDQSLFPLSLVACNNCSHLQLTCDIDPDQIFNDNYSYLSGQSQGWRSHLEKLANSIARFLETSSAQVETQKGKVLEIGSNDGSLLIALNQLGCETVGLEPSRAPAQVALSLGTDTIPLPLSEDLAEILALKYISFDLVISTNVFAHVASPIDLLNSALRLIDQNGVVIIEIQDGDQLLDRGLFDMIYHEHYSYFTRYSLAALAVSTQCILLGTQRIDTHGGSIRAFFSKNSDREIIDSLSSSFGEILPVVGPAEISSTQPRYTIFREKVGEFFTNFELQIDRIPRDNLILGIGAPAKLTTLINSAPRELRAKLNERLGAVYDSNPIKQNGWIPGTRIPIEGNIHDLSKKFIHAVIFAWNYHDELERLLISNGFQSQNIYRLNAVKRDGL